MSQLRVDSSWSLLLDRDGVINRKREGQYVTCWEEFVFLPNSLEGLAALAPRFPRIVVVTNQRGVARGLVDEATLRLIHRRMIAHIEDSGGRIDAVYYCPHDHSDDCACRKPATWMALAAQRDFPAIDFGRSLVVGDSACDIELGRRLGGTCVFVGHERPPRPVDHHCSDLLELASSITTG